MGRIVCADWGTTATLTTRRTPASPSRRTGRGPCAAQEGVALVMEYQDDSVSGAKGADQRSGLMGAVLEAERAAAAGSPYDVLVCWNEDRLSRADSLKTAVILSRLVDAGTSRILSNTGWIDLADDTHRVLFNLKQDLGRHNFLRSLSANVVRGMTAAARQGKFVGSTPPYGYLLGADGRLVSGEAGKADTVRRMFSAYIGGASLKELARDLTVRSVPSPRGKGWSRSGVRVILTNPAYKGTLVWNATHFGSFSRSVGGSVQRDAQQPAREASRRRKGHKHLDRQRNAPEDVIVVEGAHPAP